MFYTAQYLLELALLDSKMNQYAPSLQVCAALYMTMRLQIAEEWHQHSANRDKGNGYLEPQSGYSAWTHELKEHTHYSSQQLKGCARSYFQLADLI